MSDEEFLTEAVSRCEEGGGRALFTEAEIARLVSLSGVDGIDYVEDGSGSHTLTLHLVSWLAQAAGPRRCATPPEALTPTRTEDPHGG